MNFVGKILVFLIFIMSVVFMSIAVMVYATHKNWKDVVESKEIVGGEPKGMRDKIASLQKDKEELTNQLGNLESQKKEELAAKIQAITELDNKKTVLEKEQATLIKERDEFSDKEKKAVAALDTASNNLKELTEEVGTLRDEIRKALQDRDTQFARVVRLTDDNHKAQQGLDRLHERELQLVEELKNARELLAQYGKTTTSPLDPSPPALRGKVLAINDEKMVEISLGSDDGIAIGHTVDVSRGNRYVGRLVIVTTATDKAVAKIDVKYTKTPVQTGDDVSTKLRVSDQRARDPKSAAGQAK